MSEPSAHSTGRTKVSGRYVVGFDESSHVVYENGDVVFEGDEIVYVGREYAGNVDRTVTGEYLVVPGMVNMHAHVDVAHGGFWYDRGVDDIYGARPLEWVTDPDERPYFTPGDIEAGALHSMLTLLRTGTTTFSDLTTMVFKRWDDPVWEPHVYAETAGRLGLRAYLSHRFRSSFVHTNQAGEREFLRDEEQGRRGLERGIEFVERYEGAYGDRIRTMLFPYTLDTVSKDLLEETKAAAEQHDVPIRIHVAQSRFEVETIEDRHGVTPVDYLDEVGYLDDDVCLTHCLYPDGRWDDDGVPQPAEDTLWRIGDSGATVVHCPLVYRPKGGVLNGFSRYRDSGINVVLGTDTFPQNILEEMRWAALANKWVASDPTAGAARELFDAVTLGGARALNRDDLGRLAPGAKADVVVVDVADRVVHDPIRTLVHSVTPDEVEHVFVDGDQVLIDGSVPSVDERRVLEDAREVHEEMGAILAGWYDADDPADMSPPSYPVVEDADMEL